MPIYNEEVGGVFSRLQTMYEDLVLTGKDASFDFIILSDSTDPDVWLEEEEAWARLRATCRGRSGLFYRRRKRNAGHKSGNIRHFCTRWGRAYQYMIVLDADSLMAATTLLEMVRRMEEDPRIGILQSPPLAVNHRTLFARLQQFASHLYGPIFTSGYALWSQVEGTYWGHNAIIRVSAFMESCGLPELSGKAPLGGEILSHDFVEAALMRRNGWKVMVEHDLQGSYEECPTNLIDFARREQRWCQGNLQHLRLVLHHGLRPISRAQLGMGAMSYLSSPLWATFLLLVVLTGLGMARPAAAAKGTSHALGLFIGTMLLLLLPKVWGLLLALLRPGQIAGFGGPGKVIAGVGLEMLFSIAMAPILMAFHTTFVAAALLGRTVRWETQHRADTEVSWAQAVRVHAPHTIAGLCGAQLVTWLSPGLLPWMSPVLLPLVFSIPLSMVLGSSRLGRALADQRLLVIPQEIDPPRIIRRQRLLLERHLAMKSEVPHPFVRFVIVPALNVLHIALSPEGGEEPASLRMERLRRIALAGGPAHLSKDERREIISDPAALKWLHQHAWNDWPPELIERCGRSFLQTWRGDEGTYPLDRDPAEPAEAVN